MRRLALFVSMLSLTACGLLFDFGRYDTSDPALDATASEASVTEAGGFDLIVPDALTVEPGAPAASLPITLQRNGDGDDRVIISVTDAPSAFSPILASVVEPGASSTSLSIQVLARTPPGIATLHVVATEGALTRTKDVVVTLRGAPCTVDRGFGLEGDGIVRETFLQPQATAGGFFVAAADQVITSASLGTSMAIYRLDHDGNLVWVATAAGDRAVAAVDVDGGVFVPAEDSIEHFLSTGDHDRFFENAGSSCAPAAFEPKGAPAVAVLCQSGATRSGNWSLSEIDQAGNATLPDDAPFVPPATRAIVLHSSGAGFVACGELSAEGIRHAAFSRWLLDGGVDPSFGDAGAMTLGADTSVNDCIVDDAGVATLGFESGGLALLGLRADGNPDPAFGDAGVRRIDLPDAAFPDMGTPRLASTGAFLIALVAAEGGPAMLARYDRATGQLDKSFASGGFCALGPLGLGDAAALSVTSDGKVVVLANGYAELIIGRLWL